MLEELWDGALSGALDSRLVVDASTPRDGQSVWSDDDAAVALAAAETSPSATTAAAGLSVAALYVVGDRDTT